MIRYGKVVGSGPPWPVRISGDPAADILVDFQVTAFSEGDAVIVWLIGGGQYAAAKLSRGPL